MTHQVQLYFRDGSNGLFEVQNLDFTAELPENPLVAMVNIQRVQGVDSRYNEVVNVSFVQRFRILS